MRELKIIDLEAQVERKDACILELEEKYGAACEILGRKQSLEIQVAHLLDGDNWQFVFGGFIEHDWPIGSGMKLDKKHKYKVFMLDSPSSPEVKL